MFQQRPISNRPALMGILRGFLFRNGKCLVKVQGGCTEGLQRRLREGLPFFARVQSKGSRPENTWHLQRQVCLVSGYFLCLLPSCPALSGMIPHPTPHPPPPAHQPASAWLQSIKWEKRSLLVLFKMTLRDGLGRGGSGWGTHVHPWLIHVWQKPLRYCKVASNSIN